MSLSWLLLIYTVPAEPSRKRAAVWRDIKKAGAVYLRDGVCILPEREDTLAVVQAIAARVQKFGGQATIAQAARLDAERVEAVIGQCCTARAAEYAEVAREAQQLLAHMHRETEHRDFRFAELQELEADLDKLRHWVSQIRARDYFAAAEAAPVETLLHRCEQALTGLLEEASQRDEDAR